MKKSSRIKTVAINIAIAFFFTAIFVLCYYYIIEEKLSFYITVINTTAVSKTDEEEKETTYNFETSKLLNYPKLGKKFATLKIKSIDLKLPVYHGDSLKILRHGIGHYAGSYFPGENGTIILAGHNTNGMFNKLDKVKKGDKVVIEAKYATFEYQVYDMKVVDETNLKAFKIQHDEERLIMYTCYPINRSIVGRKTKRYVVYAKKVGVVNVIVEFVS